MSGTRGVQALARASSGREDSSDEGVGRKDESVEFLFFIMLYRCIFILTGFIHPKRIEQADLMFFFLHELTRFKPNLHHES